MKERHLTRTLFTLALSLLLITLFAAPAKAVKRWRQSKIGWTIWIAATDFDRRGEDDAIQRGKEIQGQGLGKIPVPVLGEDILIAVQDRGFAEYDFESSQAGKAYIYARLTTVGNPGWQLIVSLNSELIFESLRITTGGQWEWLTGDAGPLSPKRLQKGTNTLRVIPRLASRRLAPAMDIFMVSRQDGKPKDRDYTTARRFLPVEPAGNLATTWARLKN